MDIIVERFNKIKSNIANSGNIKPTKIIKYFIYGFRYLITFGIVTTKTIALEISWSRVNPIPFTNAAMIPETPNPADKG